MFQSPARGSQDANSAPLKILLKFLNSVTSLAPESEEVLSTPRRHSRGRGPQTKGRGVVPVSVQQVVKEEGRHSRVWLINTDHLQQWASEALDIVILKHKEEVNRTRFAFHSPLLASFLSFKDHEICFTCKYMTQCS